ncbi:hypothetical protein BDN70DRAFT_996938 [Pholiota conissans]|uniref:Uncharacterized protein n=1 Tax=Pholiota conissans TaxID=109636 RepID=A0A9P6CQ30_9AGAR|nr:hypothetical protein BDN70DRAFT_996938 [Pholiota conissans]
MHDPMVVPDLHNESQGHNIDVQQAKCTGRRLLKTISQFGTLGLSRTFYEARRFKPTQVLPIHPFTLDATRAIQWNTVLRTLSREWKQISIASGLILTLSIALLQIDTILQNPLGRTTAVTAAILSGQSFILAGTFTSIIPRNQGYKWSCQWIEASLSFNNLVSVEFWLFLALPLSLLVWSTIFFIITILTLLWNGGSVPVEADGGESSSRLENIVGGIFVTTLTILSIGPGYRAIKFARELH